MKNLCLLLFISCMSVASLCFSTSEDTTMNKAAAHPVVLVKTNKGDIKIELYPEKAPITVKNFLQYVQEGFYNGTIFHRVIPGFMVQGGGFDKNMKQKATHGQIKIEADNGLKNDRGTIAMARTSIPDSATAQFFINAVDNNMLNFKDKSPQGWGYAVFGKVTDGMNVVDEIIKVKTGNKDGHQNVPVVPVEITEVSVL